MRVKLVETKALDAFDARREMWIVLVDRAFADVSGFEVKGFAKKADAIRYARACSNGNVDHRVLRVTDQVLVVATENDL